MHDPPPVRVEVIGNDTPAGAPASASNPSGLRSPLPDHHANGGMSSSDTAGTPLPDQPRRPSHEEMLMRDAGLKMATRDREAIRRMRSTMEIYSENTSRRTSPLSTPTGTSSSNVRAIPAKAVSTSSAMMRKGSSERRRMLAPGLPDRSMANGGPEDGRAQKEKRLWMRGSKSALPLSTAAPDATGPPKATEYIIAVVGHAQVGKSSFIRRSVQAHGCSMPVSITIGGGYKLSSSFAVLPPSDRIKDSIRVEFVEMNVGALRPGDSASIWPRELPPIHAAVFCYDATRAGTLTHLELVLASLSASSIPVIVLACKSDPDLELAVDPAEIDEMCRTHHVGLIEVTGASPEGRSKMRNALRWLLFKLEQRAKRATRLQRSAPEATVPPSSSHPTSPVSQTWAPSLGGPVESDRSSGIDGVSGVRVRTRRPNGLKIEEDPQSSSGSLGWIMQPRKDTEMPVSSLRTKEQHSPSDSNGTITVAVNGDRPAQTVPQRHIVTDQPSPALDVASKPEALYLSLEALYNRLFTSVISNKRHTFVKAFFLTYRRFCLPVTLMQEFSIRLKEIDNSDAPREVRIWAMMRLAGALVDWTTRYPGDLADESCKALFREIVRSLAGYTFMAQLTEELTDTEAALGEAEDDDRSWALRVEGEGVQSPSTTSLRSSEGHNAIGPGSFNPPDVALESTNLNHVLGNGHSQQSGSMMASSTSLAAPNTDLRQTSLTWRGRNHSEELLRLSSSAALDENADSAPLAAAKHYFLATEPRVIAVELTKMFWATFSLVRQRDVFRHVLGKEVSDPCATCVDLFNRVSRLVSTLIMADPKPKHRARMYEKFLAISHHLGRLGNYDALYAVIAGMQETSIRRLKQTHDLVMLADPLRRDFEANLKLFDSSGAQAGYRKAIATDLQQGKSAMPLMSSLLSLVAKLRSARPNDFNEHGEVHWDKFAKYAEIVAVLAEAQNRGPGVTGTLDVTFKQIIDEAPVIMDEDDLFKRSKVVEPNNETEKEKPSQLRRMFEDLIVAPSTAGRAGS